MLEKKYRLIDDYDFKRVRKRGKIIHGSYFSVAFARSRSEDGRRFGFIVSNKITKSAVARNRIKRILRDIVKKNIDSFPRGFDIVVIAKKGLLGKDYEEINSSFNKILSKISFS